MKDRSTRLWAATSRWGAIVDVVVWLAAGFVFAETSFLRAQESTGTPTRTDVHVRRRVDALERRLARLESQSAKLSSIPSASRSRSSRSLVEAIDRLADRTDLDVTWQPGLTFRGGDDFRASVGGRIQHDVAFFSRADRSARDIEDGVELRRVRIEVAGRLFRHITFRFGVDFAGGETSSRPLWIGARRVPILGNVRVGKFTEPFGLERASSTNDVTFLERGLVAAVAPGRETGFAAFDHVDERWFWSVGVFRDTDGIGDSAPPQDGTWAVTGRFVAMPWWEDDGRRAALIGVAVSWRNPDDDTFRLRARPAVHLAPRVVDTGTFPADGVLLLGIQAAVVLTTLSIQAEYVHASVNTGDDVVDFAAWSVFASWFATGEHRRLDRRRARFAAVQPASSFLVDSGTGAVEIALRVSGIDLDDGDVTGGRMTTITVGVNWYLNSVTRVSLNYVRAEVDDSPFGFGDLDAVAMRFQIRF